MSSLPLLTLAQVANSTVGEVGEKAFYLAKLHLAGFPIPSSLVVPRSFLVEIAKKNQLPDFISKLAAEGDLEERHGRQAIVSRITSFIEQQEIPEKTSISLLRQLAAQFGNRYVAVRTSEKKLASTNFHRAALTISGETNILKAILVAWANEFTEKTLVSRLQELPLNMAVPAACLIQELIVADVSGVAFTQHPITQQKQLIFIASTWGIGDHLQGDETDLDTYEVDVRTSHIIKRSIALKTTEHVRTDTRNQLKPLSKDVMLLSSLTDPHIQILTKLITKLKRHHLEHLKIRWCFRFLDPFIIGVEVYNPDETATQQFNIKEKVQSTRTAVLASVSNPIRTAHAINSNIDGIGLLKSDFTWMKLDKHPLYLLDQQRHSLIKHELTKTVRRFVEKLSPDQKCIYRPLALTSSQLRNLEHGYEYEPKELNPSLGFNGSLRLVHQPEILHLEIEVINEVATRYNRTIAFLLPGVRSLYECKRLSEMVRSKLDLQRGQLWYELSTPYVLSELTAFLEYRPQGLVIDSESIMALSGGYDRQNPDIAHFFAQEQLSMLQKYLQAISKNIQASSTDIPVYLTLTEPTQDLVQSALDNHLSGIISPVSRVALLKRFVMSIEHASLEEAHFK